MSKKILKCTCETCGNEFEIEADFIVPGIEGFMTLAGGEVRILDPTKKRRCDICMSFMLEDLMKGAAADG